MKVLILTMANNEDSIIEKVLTALANETSVEYAHISDSSILNYGALKIDPVLRAVYLNGIEVSFTKREFDVLYFIAQHPGQVFTMQQLYESTIQEPYYETFHTVMSAIYRIRKKIGHKYIINVRGYGYKFEWKT